MVLMSPCLVAEGVLEDHLSFDEVTSRLEEVEIACSRVLHGIQCFHLQLHCHDESAFAR